MRKMQLLGTLAALSFAAASHAQPQPPPAHGHPVPGSVFKTSDQHRVSKFVDSEVQTPKGENVGKVEELVFDDSGAITHVVISYGGTLGMGGKLTAVPWQTFSSGVSGNKVVLDESRIKQAPSFDQSHWPDLTKPNWGQPFDQYWKQQGAMRSAAAPPDDASPQQGATSSMPGQPPGATTSSMPPADTSGTTAAPPPR